MLFINNRQLLDSVLLIITLDKVDGLVTSEQNSNGKFLHVKLIVTVVVNFGTRLRKHDLPWWRKNLDDWFSRHDTIPAYHGPTEDTAILVHPA